MCRRRIFPSGQTLPQLLSFAAEHGQTRVLVGWAILRREPQDSSTRCPEICEPVSDIMKAAILRRKNLARAVLVPVRV
jgi:hypothetical protein